MALSSPLNRACRWRSRILAFSCRWFLRAVPRFLGTRGRRLRASASARFGVGRPFLPGRSGNSVMAGWGASWGFFFRNTALRVVQHARYRVRVTHMPGKNLPPDFARTSVQVRDVVQNQQEKMRSDLEELVRIPSVSDPAFDQQFVDASAQRVAEMFQTEGMPKVDIVRADKPDGTPGAPAVIAHRPARGSAPTILLYAHHDVQPPGDEALWDSPVFMPTERDGRIYGRGAADDKAGVVAHLAALRAIFNTEFDSGVGVTVLIEGEEEIGSPSMGAFLDMSRDRLSAVAVIIADSITAALGVPAFTTSLRGLVDLVVEVRTLEQAGHSGLFGGPAPDALTALGRLLATLHDENGDVAVAGLVRNPDPGDLVEETSWRADAQILPGVQSMGTGSLAQRLWASPALSVLGIDAPPVAGAANILVPSAAAKLSMRVPAGQDPASAAQLLKKHLHAHAPFGAEVIIKDGELGKPYSAAQAHPAMELAKASFAAGWEHGVEEIGIGASIPVVADLDRKSTRLNSSH